MDKVVWMLSGYGRLMRAMGGRRGKGGRWERVEEREEREGKRVEGARLCDKSLS